MVLSNVIILFLFLSAGRGAVITVALYNLKVYSKVLVQIHRRAFLSTGRLLTCSVDHV